MWEWLNALSDSSTRALACEGYRRTHADPTIEVVAFHTELIAAALELYRTREDKNWSLTDCMSFAVMKRRGLKECLPYRRRGWDRNITSTMLRDLRGAAP